MFHNIMLPCNPHVVFVSRHNKNCIKVKTNIILGPMNYGKDSLPYVCIEIVRKTLETFQPKGNPCRPLIKPYLSALVSNGSLLNLGRLQ